NVIPGYGFPIDVVPLKVYDRCKGEFNKKLDINRDLSVAISEYAPDSEVIVDKVKYTSRYIVIPKDEQLHIRYYYKCTNDKCGKVSISEHQQDSDKCIYCGDDTVEHKFITPQYGFITDDKNK